MSSAALAMLAPESKSATTTSSKVLKVSEPGDAHEREADQVADVVVAGGRVPNWSLAASGAGLIQRDTDTARALPAQPPVRMIGDSQDPPAANNYGDMLAKLAEAFLKTEAGKAITNYIEDRPIVKAAKDFVETPAGVVVAGSTAIAAIGGLAAAGKGLPAQLPAIPLDTLLPGLSVKIDVEGPLNHPTQGSLMFTFGAAPPKKKKGGQSESEKYRAETARMAQAMKFGAGVDPGRLGPVPSADGQERQAEAKAAENYELRRMGAILQPSATHRPSQFTPLVPGTQPKSLRMRDDASLPNAASTPSAAKNDPSKKEEIPLQRKAESRPDALLPDATSEVESVTRSSSGRPLDRQTRSAMESRIGFDFGKVRIHTDARAAASARALGARAYTVGNNVVFSAGRFAPNTTEGRRLLAHELTHVVQQSPDRAANCARRNASLPFAIAAAPVQIQRDEDSSGAPEEESESRFVRWIREKLKDAGAKDIPGYRLFSVIYGKDILENKRVESNATNLTEAVVDLVGAQQTYEQIKASGALTKAYEWLKAGINGLGFTRESFTRLFDDVRSIIKSNWDSPREALRLIKALFREPYEKLTAFAKQALDKLFEFVIQATLEAIGGKEILETLAKARDTFQLIIKNPVGFLKNLFEAVKQGFLKFKDDILKYLKDGLVKWLSDELESAGIPMPKSFSLKEIGGIALQVLGLTKENFRTRVANAIGQKALEQIENSLDIVKEVQEQGPIALWNRAVAYAGDLTNTIISSISSWITKTIVENAILKLAPLLTPVGAVVEAIIDVVKTAKIIFEKIRKLTALVRGIVDSVADIAAANIPPAAQKIVETLVRAIPLVLNFLASYLNLNGIGKQIGEALESIRERINKAIDRVVETVVAKARALLSKGKQAVISAIQWWKQRKKVKVGKVTHEVYLKGSGDHPEVIVETTPTPLERFLAEVKATEDEKQEIFALVKKLKWSTEDEKKDTASVKPQGDGASVFEQIVEKIGNLKSAKNFAASESVFKRKQETNSLGGGKHADVWLSSVHAGGTGPEQTSPNILHDLGDDLISQKRYMRGHLLSESLGGPGKWENMMPMTNSANQTIANRAEHKVIKALASGKALIHYTVEADYDESVKDIPITPQRAEQRLKRLTWKWNPAAFEGNQWKDTSEVPKDEKDKAIPDVAGQGELDPKQTKAAAL